MLQETKRRSVPAEQCAAPSAHIDAWHIEGGQVVCSICHAPAQATGTIAGGWYDVASVLKTMPIFHEVIKRAIEREGAQE